MLYNMYMKKILVKLISTEVFSDEKFKKVENLFIKNGYQFEFEIISQKEVKNKNVKNSLINKMIKLSRDDLILLDFDQNFDVIEKFVKGVLTELENNDIVFAKKERGKFFTLLSKIKYFFYNLILKIFKRSEFVDNVKGFYYLNQNIINVITLCDKPPCEMLGLKNFNGFDISYVTIKEEKKFEKNKVKSKILALFIFVLSIIFILTLTLLSLKMNLNEYLDRIIIVDILIFILGLFSSMCVLVKSKYKNLEEIWTE